MSFDSIKPGLTSPKILWSITTVLSILILGAGIWFSFMDRLEFDHLMAEENQKQSIEVLEKDLSGKPDQPRKAYHLGILYRRAGDQDQALKHFQSLLDHKPDESELLLLLYANLGELQYFDAEKEQDPNIKIEKLRTSLESFKLAAELVGDLGESTFDAILLQDLFHNLKIIEKKYKWTLRIMQEMKMVPKNKAEIAAKLKEVLDSERRIDERLKELSLGLYDEEDLQTRKALFEERFLNRKKLHAIKLRLQQDEKTPGP